MPVHHHSFREGLDELSLLVFYSVQLSFLLMSKDFCMGVVLLSKITNFCLFGDVCISEDGVK